MYERARSYAQHVELSGEAMKQLKKLDKHTAALIIGWLRKNLEGCSDPRQHGKGLTANRSGQWRYRVGDYRILAEIQDEKIVVLVLSIGHRSEIYTLSLHDALPICAYPAFLIASLPPRTAQHAEHRIWLAHTFE